MLTLVIAIVLSFIAGALINHFASKRTAAKLKSITDKNESSAFRDGFNRGWKHAGMDWTYVRTRYEHFTTFDK